MPLAGQSTLIAGGSMKKRNTKGVVDVKKGVSVVHLNVSSGYLAYVSKDKGEESKVHSVTLEGRRRSVTP